jgi:GxxExxY protein
MTSTDELTSSIIGAAIEVHQCLGPGFLENVYEKALCHEFDLRNIPYHCQMPITVRYKGAPVSGQRLDLVAFDRIVIELKASQDNCAYSAAQVLSYLKATELRRGLVINFGRQRLVDGICRVVCDTPPKP